MTDETGDHGAMLSETAKRVFAAAPLWQTLSDAGLPWVMTGAEHGGFGGGFGDAQRVFFEAGAAALDFPIAETINAAAVLSRSGHSPVGSSLTLAQSCTGKLDTHGSTFGGTLCCAGADAERVAALITHDGKPKIAVLALADAKSCESRASLAGEALREFHFDGARAEIVASVWDADRLFHAMALARACQIAGAISACLEMTAYYARERQQFGKPLASFQAIQQQMAVLAEEAAAARAACASAARAADRCEASFEIACAKLRANMAAGQAASIAHQVHGAIGFTKEYRLQKFTRRLWAWRSEYGNDRHWASRIGDRVAQRGADEFWPGLVAGFAA